MEERKPQSWDVVDEHLPTLLHQLGNSAFIARNRRGGFPTIPEKGIYAFYEAGRPVYVGRSDRMRSRIQEHGRAGSQHNSATFAFLLATIAAQAKGIDCTTPTRNDLQKADDFKPLYDEAKERVRKMEFKVVEIVDPIEQAVFEVYAALHLKTTLEHCGYNDFQNH